MDIFKSAVAVAWGNLCRWKMDLRIGFILLFTALVIIKDMHSFTQYGLDMERQCTVCMLPILFLSFTISVGTVKMVVFAGLLLLLCDVPFITQVSPYVFYRSGRRAWWISGCIYIVFVTFLYTVFITLVSSLTVLPVASFDNGSWGGVLEDMIFGSETMTAEEIYKIYWHVALPELSIQYLKPYMAQAYTFITVWTCFIFLGLLMYLVSQFTRNVLWILGVAGFFVFLDPILTWYAWGKSSWLLIFSPVCWVSPEVLDIVSESQFLSIPFVAFTFVILLSILLICIRKSCLWHKELQMTLNGL